MGARSWNDGYYEGVPVGIEINPFKEDLTRKNFTWLKTATALLLLLALTILFGYLANASPADHYSAWGDRWAGMFYISLLLLLAFLCYTISLIVAAAKARIVKKN